MILIRLRGLAFDGEEKDYGSLTRLTGEGSLVSQLVEFLRMYRGIASQLRDRTHGLMLTPRDVSLVVEPIMQLLIGGMHRGGEFPAQDVELQAAVLTPVLKEIGMVVQPLFIPRNPDHPERGSEACALVIKRA